jgi:hypothetical protein
MHRALLVKQAIVDGKKLVDRLRLQHFPISAAFWYHDSDAIRWRLVMASPSADSSGPIASYSAVQQALFTLQPSTVTLHDISVVSPRGTDFLELRNWLESARIAAQQPRDVWSEDAYVYRL